MNVDIGGGRGELAGQEQAIRTLAGARKVEDLAQTTIVLSGGRKVKLADLGTVTDTAAEPRRFARLYYQTDHSLKEVRAPGYFAPAAQALRRCDIIEVWAGSGSEPVYEELVVVGVTAAGQA